MLQHVYYIWYFYAALIFSKIFFPDLRPGAQHPTQRGHRYEGASAGSMPMAWAGLSGVCRCCRPCWARCSDPRARAGRPLLPSTRVPEPESQLSSRHTGRAPPAPLRAQGHTQPDTNMEGHTCLEAEVASARTEDQTDSCSRGWELSSIWADTSCYGLHHVQV